MQCINATLLSHSGTRHIRDWSEFWNPGLAFDQLESTVFCRESCTNSGIPIYSIHSEKPVEGLYLLRTSIVIRNLEIYSVQCIKLSWTVWDMSTGHSISDGIVQHLPYKDSNLEVWSWSVLASYCMYIYHTRLNRPMQWTNFSLIFMELKIQSTICSPCGILHRMVHAVGPQCMGHTRYQVAPTTMWTSRVWTLVLVQGLSVESTTKKANPDGVRVQCSSSVPFMWAFPDSHTNQPPPGRWDFMPRTSAYLKSRSIYPY